MFLTPHLAYLLGFLSTSVPINTPLWMLDKMDSSLALKAVYKMNIHLYRPPYMMIYLNILDLSPVHETYTNILSVVPISNMKSDNSEYQTFEAQNITFRELSITRITEIKTTIRDHTGNLIPFENDNVTAHLIFTNQPDTYK